MYTQCPKCQSIFMVSEDDIKAHEGLVRCGNCYSIFNAEANLTDAPRPEEDGAAASAAEVNATPVELPPGAAVVGSSSGFAFSFIEEPATTDEQATDDSDIEHDEAPGELPPLDEKDMEPFPEPDLSPDAIVAPEHEEKPADTGDDLLYFGPDLEQEVENEPVLDAVDAEIAESPLLMGNVFDPSDTGSTQESGDDAMIDESSIPELDATLDEDYIVETDEALITGHFEKFSPPEEDIEPFSSPEISTDQDIEDSDFELPDFSPLDGLEEDLDQQLTPVANMAGEETSQDQADAVETHLDPEALWPGEMLPDDDLPNIEKPEQTSPLPDPKESPRFISDVPPIEETELGELGLDDTDIHAGMQEDDQHPDEGNHPSLDSEQERPDVDTGEQPDRDSWSGVDAAIDSIPGDEEEVSESVFITADEEDASDIYQPINVANDKAFHESSDDFPLPDDLEEIGKFDTSDIDKLLNDAVKSQASIEAKLEERAEEGEEPELGEPEAEEEDEQETVLTPVDGAEQEKTRRAGLGFIADKFRFGRRAYHGLDTQTSPEAELLLDIDRETRRGSTGTLSPGLKKGLLAVGNLVLLVALIYQLGFYFMDDLVKIRSLRPLLEVGCNIAGCTLPQPSNPASIEQLSSKMTVIEGKQGGLRIALTLINRDREPQPFPALELSLTDRSGRVISRRVIEPGQYLPPSAMGQSMQPDQAEDVNILLHTPAVRVDGFEVRPVRLHWLANRKNL